MRNRADAHDFAAFTDRERQIVVHAALGMSNKEIARAAGKMGVRSRSDLLSLPPFRAAH